MILNLVGKLFSIVRESVFSETNIPTYSELTKERGEAAGDEVTNKLLNFSLFLCTTIMILGLVFAPYIVKMFAIGYDGDKLKIASLFMRAVILTMYPNIYAAIFSSYLQIKGDFITPALPLLILNIILGITVVISKGNIYIMAIGIFLAYFIQFAIFPQKIRKTGFKRTKVKLVIDEDIKRIIKLSIPTIFSMAAVYISTIVDQSFASIVASDGGVSVIN